ncbi:MAG TPA: hypothetical protein PKI20_11235 [Verrucomicrobiota bacterium]|jgi:hypothetical protein|nr:hypothetical protein [Verrucomicrobiota bacterium]HQL78164.1 hypothetical protein [Verrucomicrobiota bacterium]
MRPPSSRVRSPQSGSAPALEFHLFTEPLAGEAPPLCPVPAGVSHFAGREPAFPVPVVLEPVRQQRGHLRLLARFSQAGAAQVNGEPAPSTVVLAPGDWFRCGTGPVVRVALFNRPQLGPPPAAELGKPCLVCSVPFTTAATCLVCPCGLVLHCEPDERDGLQCAQLRRTCPRCGRTLALDESYVNPGGSNE